MQPPNNDDAVWLVSFADDDDRELTAEQIAKALTAGEIVLTTIVWRDGMSDWTPIVEVPELRSVVQKQRIARKRSTVMGGFGTPGTPPIGVRPPTPAPPMAAPVPRPPTAGAQPPRPGGVALGGTGGTAAFTGGPPRPGAPKGSLLTGGSSTATSRSRDDEPESLEDLGSGLLEAVPSEAAHTDRSRDDDKPRTTLTGPVADFSRSAGAGGFSADDAEPISLIPESIVPESAPESLDSAELQSMLDQQPPAARGPKIFEIDVKGGTRVQYGGGAPSQEIDVDVDSEPNVPASDDADDDVLSVEEASPSVRVFSPEPVPNAEHAKVSRGPSPPTPPRPVHAPLPQASDPLADLDEEFEGPKKKGGAGKFLIAALVIGFCAGAFYLGRRSANPEMEAENAVPSAVPAQTNEATPAAEETTPADEAPAPDTTAESNEDEEEDVEERDEENQDVNVAAKAPARGPSSPKSRSPSSGNADEFELKEEPSLAKAPGPSKPEPPKQPKEKQEESEDPEPAGPFDRDAAAAALSRAAGAAGSCRTGSDPSGVAQVSVTFSPSGRATRAIVEGPPFAGTQTGGCIASRMRGAKIPPFTGSRVTVKKRVVIQ